MQPTEIIEILVSTGIAGALVYFLRTYLPFLIESFKASKGVKALKAIQSIYEELNSLGVELEASRVLVKYASDSGSKLDPTKFLFTSILYELLLEKDNDLIKDSSIRVPVDQETVEVLNQLTEKGYFEANLDKELSTYVSKSGVSLKIGNLALSLKLDKAIQYFAVPIKIDDKHYFYLSVWWTKPTEYNDELILARCKQSSNKLRNLLNNELPDLKSGS